MSSNNQATVFHRNDRDNIHYKYISRLENMDEPCITVMFHEKEGVHSVLLGGETCGYRSDWKVLSNSGSWFSVVRKDGTPIVADLKPTLSEFGARQACYLVPVADLDRFQIPAHWRGVDIAVIHGGGLPYIPKWLLATEPRTIYIENYDASRKVASIEGIQQLLRMVHTVTLVKYAADEEELYACLSPVLCSLEVRGARQFQMKWLLSLPWLQTFHFLSEHHNTLFPSWNTEDYKLERLTAVYIEANLYSMGEGLMHVPNLTHLGLRHRDFNRSGTGKVQLLWKPSPLLFDHFKTHLKGLYLNNADLSELDVFPSVTRIPAIELENCLTESAKQASDAIDVDSDSDALAEFRPRKRRLIHNLTIYNQEVDYLQKFEDSADLKTMVKLCGNLIDPIYPPHLEYHTIVLHADE